MAIKLIVAIILCFLPAVIGFFIFNKGFKIKTSLLLISMFFAALCLIPIFLINSLTEKITFSINHPVFYQILKSIILIGLVEELCKTLLISFFPKKNISLLTFFILSLTFGLTLGCFETVGYYLGIFSSNLSRKGTTVYSLVIERFLTADLIHMTCAGLCGLFVYSIRIEGEKLLSISCILHAILLHGLYDFFAPFTNYLHYFAIPVILLAILQCRIKYTSLKNINKSA